jgi:hypothetical protein
MNVSFLNKYQNNATVDNKTTNKDKINNFIILLRDLKYYQGLG